MSIFRSNRSTEVMFVDPIFNFSRIRGFQSSMRAAEFEVLSFSCAVGGTLSRMLPSIVE